MGEEGTQRKFSSPQSAGFISEECPRLLENSFPHLELKIDSSGGGKGIKMKLDWRRHWHLVERISSKGRHSFYEVPGSKGDRAKWKIFHPP